jgi:hypothetical protein
MISGLWRQEGEHCMRPKAIERFARLYPVSILIGLVINVLTWDDYLGLYNRTEMRESGSLLLIALLTLGVALSVVLWYLIVWKRNNIARWVAVAIFLVTAVGVVSMLLAGKTEFDLAGILGLVRFLVHAAAVRELVTAQAGEWFDPKLPAKEPWEAEPEA